jgi:hypothetical protein
VDGLRHGLPGLFDGFGEEWRQDGERVAAARIIGEEIR